MSDISTLLAEFPKKKILVVGDIMLDEYIEGHATRISPEAPIPVLVQRSVRHVLGGAGNVAANVTSLGGRATLLGVVGSDTHAKILSKLAREQKVHAQFVIDVQRPTTTKLRFVSDHHQLVRIDIEETSDLKKKVESKLIALIRTLPRHDFVIVSDYAKGTVTKNVLSALKARFGAESIIADMKPINAAMFEGIYAITPNVKEAAEMTGVFVDSDEAAEEVTKNLQSRFHTSIVLTRGEKGVSVREKGKKCVHFKSDVRSVRDVTGAGDTMIAAIALLLASGAALPEATSVGNTAAGMVVGVGGTYALPGRQLEAYFRDGQ